MELIAVLVGSIILCVTAAKHRKTNVGRAPYRAEELGNQLAACFGESGKLKLANGSRIVFPKMGVEPNLPGYSRHEAPIV